MGNRKFDAPAPLRQPQKPEQRQRVGPPRTGDKHPLTADPGMLCGRPRALKKSPRELSEGLADGWVTWWHAILAMIPCAP